MEDKPDATSAGLLLDLLYRERDGVGGEGDGQGDLDLAPSEASTDTDPEAEQRGDSGRHGSRRNGSTATVAAAAAASDRQSAQSDVKRGAVTQMRTDGAGFGG